MEVFSIFLNTLWYNTISADVAKTHHAMYAIT